MATPSARRGDGFLFPPPPKLDGKILCLVVEKKGDETRTSMRQSEIYAFSNDIIIRDGYMVMPKICWNDYNPGDWFQCHREFSVDRHGNQKEERELIDLHKLDRSSHKTFNIPLTNFEHGYVQVLCPFVLCPDFIRNKEIRNSYGVYKKLYLYYMGQGFVHNVKKDLYSRLVRGRVYNGIFEFHAKDNGAVNFGHRNEIRDSTGHVLERDAMWELVRITDQTLLDREFYQKNDIPIAEHSAMRGDLDDLLNWAGKYEDELYEKGCYGPPPPKAPKDVSLLVPPPPPVVQKPNPLAPSAPRAIQPPLLRIRSTGNERADQLIQELTQIQCPGAYADRTLTSARATRGPSRDPSRGRAPAPIRREIVHLEPNETGTLRNEETVDVSGAVFGGSQPTEVYITNRAQLEVHRTRTIMRAWFRDRETQELVHKWIDRETNETSTDNDLLNYKFDSRHGAFEDPPFSYALLLQEQERLRIGSDSSFFHNITASERPPLASSTPLGSPEPQRRELPTRPSSRAAYGNQTIRSHLTTDSDDTERGTLHELQKDNNANPMRARQNYGPANYRT